MCGIAGFVGPLAQQGAQAETAIAQMIQRMLHRGPDGQGYWGDAHAGVMLGHARLAIVDTSEAGRQPMHLGHLHAVVNGEIYNYPELRRELETRYGAQFASHCDSEVVLHGYAHEGTAFFARMNGMFAFALYDAATRRLMLVRDRVGIKPVYYCARAEGLFFASEIKGLLAPFSGSDWAVDAVGLSQYLSFQTALAGRTLFAGVSLLRPGYMLSVSLDAPQQYDVSRYVGMASHMPPVTTFEQARHAFRDVFEASVSRHLLSDVPIAGYISAGMDSATVLHTAAHALVANGPMHAFTGRFPDETDWYDESSVAAEAVAAFGGVHCPVDITPTDFDQQLDAVVAALDEPKMGMGAFSQFVVARQVAARFKVVLTGHGGDELFAGYPIFKLARMANWRHLRRSELPHVVYFLLSALRRLFQPEFGRYLPVLWSRRAQRKLLARPLADAGYWQPLALLHTSSMTLGERIEATYMQEYLPNLLVVEDKISMVHRLESRTPFLDHALLDLSQRIAMEVKLHDGTLKALIKDYARQHLPAIYFSQPKRGFPTPLRRWLRTTHTHLLTERLLAEGSPLWRILSREEVRAQVDAYLHSWRRHLRPLDEIQSHRMWQLLCLESWVRQWQQHYGIRLVMAEQ